MNDRQRIEKAFSHVLLQARRQAGLSQRALAAAASVDQSYVVRMEKGLRLPALEALIALERALNLTAGKLTKLTSEELANPSLISSGSPKTSRIKTQYVDEEGDDEAEGENLRL